MKNYEVKVNGKNVNIEACRVSAAPINKLFDGIQRDLSQSEEAYFITVDICGQTELEITVNEGFDSYEIRPLAFNIPCERTGNSVKITVDRPMQFTFEPDGYHEALHIFINNKKPEIPTVGKVRYFGPGEHHENLIMLESDETVYIDEGAIVYGAILGMNVHNVKIMGRGVLDSSMYRRGNDLNEGGQIINDAYRAIFPRERDMKYVSCFVLYNCKDINVEGIIIKDAPLWAVIVRNNCENILIDNIKLIGMWRYNSDGIDICASKNVIIRNSFIRSYDDCFVARGAYLEGEEEMDLENMIVENCVAWCDWGKAFEVWNGQYPTAIRNVVFRDNYVIRMSAAIMSITTYFGSSNTVIENITFKNIFADGDKEYIPALIEKSKWMDKEWRDDPDATPFAYKIICEMLGKPTGEQQYIAPDNNEGFHLHYRNITIEDIHYNGKKLRTWVVPIDNILTIDNLYISNCELGEM